MDSPRYAYLLIYDGNIWTHEQVKTYLNYRDEILNWYFLFPSTFFLVSPWSASQLSGSFRDKFTHGKGHFLILDVQTDKDGWLPSAVWDFLNNKKAAGEP